MYVFALFGDISPSHSYPTKVTISLRTNLAGTLGDISMHSLGWRRLGLSMTFYYLNDWWNVHHKLQSYRITYTCQLVLLIVD